MLACVFLLVSGKNVNCGYYVQLVWKGDNIAVTGKLEEWFSIPAPDKKGVECEAMAKVAEVMDKVVNGRAPMFFVYEVTSELWQSLLFLLFLVVLCYPVM